MGDELLEEDVLALGVVLEDLVPAVAGRQEPVRDVKDSGPGPGPVRPVADQEGLQHVEDGLEAVLLGHLLLGPHGLHLEATALLRGWGGTEQGAWDLNIDFKSIQSCIINLLSGINRNPATDKLVPVKVNVFLGLRLRISKNSMNLGSSDLVRVSAKEALSHLPQLLPEAGLGGEEVDGHVDQRGAGYALGQTHAEDCLN